MVVAIIQKTVEVATTSWATIIIIRVTKVKAIRSFTISAYSIVKQVKTQRHLEK
jgi:hypothetical protein